MESAETHITLREMPLGGRLLIRSRTDWRVAVVSRIIEDRITLSVSSPKGRNYRLRRLPESEIFFDGTIPFLVFEADENWRENFAFYDSRW
ncbi:MAG: hypothetical protein ACR2M8_13480 [Pyrinomonadaceae bacterium]|nr:hypothetical protein [Blastocatellia bacterium]MDQ3219671.1 hypothetical protein [Acidobacteriota bacterium]